MKIKISHNVIHTRVISILIKILSAVYDVKNKVNLCNQKGPPLWSSCQSYWLQIQRSRVRFPALPDFLRSSGSGTGSTQPREKN
jgi:hypothetical protein